MFRLPSPSLVVSIIALVIALGGAGYTATGGNFILGRLNNASTQTELRGPVAGKNLQLNNQSTAANATALGLAVATGRPPIITNSKTKVGNLNVDLLDSLDSTDFARADVIDFDLAAGQTSGPIQLPSERPVFVVGVTTTSGFRGVGHASLLKIPGNFIEWTGLESTSGSVITQGFSGSTGTHILFIDFSHQVDIEVSGPDAIRITNSSAGRRVGKITLTY